jgi:sodium transport system ATP-binding protein
MHENARSFLEDPSLMAIVQVRELSKVYSDFSDGAHVAVDRISFSVGAGEIFGLLGPNGAGKTTTLRMLSTILRPTSGQIVINNADIGTDAHAIRKSIGFVSNNTALYDRMSARELVEYFGRLHGMERDELKGKIEVLFKKLCMSDIGNVACGKMSTGMKQKVSIARALIHDPPVLIFDEASVGLDIIVARALLHTIASLRDDGKCIIFSTHIMREVEKLCDRVAMMHRGRILDIGTIDELADKHQHNDFEDLFFSLLTRHDELDAGSGEHAVDQVIAIPHAPTGATLV